MTGARQQIRMMNELAHIVLSQTPSALDVGTPRVPRFACYNLTSPAHNRGDSVISSEGEFRINQDH